MPFKKKLNVASIKRPRTFKANPTSNGKCPTHEPIGACRSPQRLKRRTSKIMFQNVSIAQRQNYIHPIQKCLLKTCWDVRFSNVLISGSYTIENLGSGLSHNTKRSCYAEKEEHEPWKNATRIVKHLSRGEGWPRSVAPWPDCTHNSGGNDIVEKSPHLCRGVLNLLTTESSFECTFHLFLS